MALLVSLSHLPHLCFTSVAVLMLPHNEASGTAPTPSLKSATQGQDVAVPASFAVMPNIAKA